MEKGCVVVFVGKFLGLKCVVNAMEVVVEFFVSVTLVTFARLLISIECISRTMSSMRDLSMRLTSSVCNAFSPSL